MCIVMPSLFVNCPTVICSPNMLFILWRDTTSELWTPVHSLHRLQSTAILVLTVLCKHHHPHYTSNPFLQQAGEIENLTVTLGQSNLVVLCRFHVGAGISGVAPHYTPPPTTFTCSLTPTGSINLGFLLRENLLLYASHLPLGVPNGR